jgi:serine/threonine protein kinase
VASARGFEPVPGALRGRVAYMAPEQARSERLEARADVFSLAVVLWELLAGERLFWRGNALASLRAVCEDTVPGLETRVPTISDGLATLIARSLSRDRVDRPDSATLARELAGFAELDPDHLGLVALATGRA